MKTEKIPSELKEYPQWVAWQAKPKDNGKTDKLPISPVSGGYAKSNDPGTWGTFDQSVKHCESKKLAGVGFVFNGDSFAGVDLDNCITDGKLAGWASDIIKDFNSYSEISPSGTGVKIFCKGQLSGGGIKKGDVEIYDKGRFFTVTGDVLNGYETLNDSQVAINDLVGTLRPDEANKIIDLMLSNDKDGKILSLFNGKWQGLYPSQSEADQALCSFVGRYTRDRELIDRVFRKSDLFRDKWDRKHFGDGRTYGEATIQNALKSDVKPATAAGPSMGDLREYIDLCVVPGQKITVDEICRGLSCYKRDERKFIYTYIGRLCTEGVLKKDNYKHGGYRRVVTLDSFDLGGVVSEDMDFRMLLPLDLHKLLRVKPDHLLQVSGRYDAGKSTFLFQIMADNYQNNKIVHIVSEEWSLNAIKERLDILGIPRPHENIKVIPMQPGFEDAIPEGRCIVLIDYLRADQNPFETDTKIQRILKNLKGGVAVFATQKHPGLDRPVGGQFAVHASHHIVMLDKWKDFFTCKIYRTKNGRNLEGLFRTFKLNQQQRIYPIMDTWKQGNIKWDNDNNDNKDNISDVSKRGGVPVIKEKEKERTKEKEKENSIANASQAMTVGGVI